MATLRAAIKTLLEADGTLTATMTGGLHDQTEISPSGTPSAYDTRGDLKPCGVLRMGTMTPLEPFDTAERQFFTLYWYEKPGGYANIDVMKYRAKTLLHTTTDSQKQVTVDPGFVYELRHADDFGDSWDDSLKVPMNYSRFYAVLLRS